MTCNQTLLVGAYALGTLDPAEQESFNDHLKTCDSCLGELTDLEGLIPLLGAVTADDLTAPTNAEPNDDLLERLLASARQDSDELHQRRRAKRLLAVAAVVVVAAIGTTAGIVATSGSHFPAYSSTAGSVAMRVELDAQTSGTQLTIKVSGLPEGEHCQLEAISTTGSEEVAGTWTASYAGAASVSGYTSFTPNQLSRFVLLGTTGKRLITVAT